MWVTELFKHHTRASRLWWYGLFMRQYFAPAPAIAAATAAIKGLRPWSIVESQAQRFQRKMVMRGDKQKNTGKNIGGKNRRCVQVLVVLDLINRFVQACVESACALARDSRVYSFNSLNRVFGGKTGWRIPPTTFSA